MAIQIIRDDEHLTCEIWGVTFHYKRVAPDAIDRLQREHTKRGELDQAKVAGALLESAVFNWSGPIHMGNPGEPTPFAPELIKYLPAQVKLALAQVIAGNVDGEHQRVDPT